MISSSFWLQRTPVSREDEVPYMGQSSYEVDITYLMLAIVLIVLGRGCYPTEGNINSTAFH